MDTRDKILTLEAARALPRRQLTVASGYFDGLGAAHARELAAVARPVLAVVLPRAGELLPQRARAEMAAAMRVIDYVVTADERDLDALIDCLAPRAVVRLEAADAVRVQQLIEHVQRRHSQ